MPDHLVTRLASLPADGIAYVRNVLRIVITPPATTTFTLMALFLACGTFFSLSWVIYTGYPHQPLTAPFKTTALLTLYALDLAAIRKVTTLLRAAANQ